MQYKTFDLGCDFGDIIYLIVAALCDWTSRGLQIKELPTTKEEGLFSDHIMCRQPACENGEGSDPHFGCQEQQQELYLSVFEDVERADEITPEQAVLAVAYDLQRWPTTAEMVEEMKAVGRIAGPMVLTGLLLYSRAMISMLFLGYLGELELAGGSLSIGFANITGYSVISGLAMGMEPICGQAYGAKRWSLLGLTLQRTVLFLLCAAVPIGILWSNMERILVWCGQNESITAMAGTYIIFSLPDLLAQAFLHPLRIYMRTQNITVPLTVCAAIALLLHVPLNALLVVYLNMRIRGVALAAVWSNFNLVLSLLGYLWLSEVCKRSWVGLSRECLKGWRSLLSLAIPSCISVCLEWWWYEFMIILCGLLLNPQATVASMGILIQTTALVYVFPSSLSLGVSTRVGNELGANRPAKARTAMIVALACAAVLGLAAMTFTTAMRHTWGRMFTKDTAILRLTSVTLPIVGLCELGNCPQTTGCGVLRGSARPTTGANINLGSFYFVGMPVAIAMGFLFNVGFTGLWLGLLAAQTSCAALMLSVLLRTDWILQAQRAKELIGSNQVELAESVKYEESCHKAAEDQKQGAFQGDEDSSEPLITNIKFIQSEPRTQWSVILDKECVSRMHP